jgi:two-component system response regulator GlrR
MADPSCAAQPKVGSHGLDVLFFLNNPRRVALTLDMLSPVFQCSVSHPQEAVTIGKDREPVSSAVVMVVNQAGLDTCCDVLHRFVLSYPKVPVMVLTDTVEPPGVARLLGCGAFDFADLHGSRSETLLRVHRVAGSLPPESIKLDPEENALEIDPEVRRRLIGTAPKFLELLKRLCAMARSHTSVMLLGETGTGKEVSAQAIHYCSPRAGGPWVAVNCATIPTELMEDELYGHVRGAYTHAHATRRGLVCEADRGTLFLDEVDSLPLAAQAKLLRFLQDGEYRAVGSNSVHRADVRVLAASNIDLRMAVANGHGERPFPPGPVLPPEHTYPDHATPARAP